jgi:hypothetical protein
VLLGRVSVTVCGHPPVTARVILAVAEHRYCDATRLTGCPRNTVNLVRLFASRSGGAATTMQPEDSYLTIL